MSYTLTDERNHPSREKKGLAIASLVLGIMAIFFLGPLAGLPAVICGGVVWVKTVRDPMINGGKGVAIGGMVLGLLGGVGWTVAWMVLYSAASNSMAVVMRAKDMEHVRLLTQAVLRHADAAGAFPESLGESFKYCNDPKVYVSPGSGTQALELPINMSDPHFTDELLKHCDYVYIGGDLPGGGMRVTSGSIIVVYSKEVKLGGRSLGYSDGHVEFVAKEKVENAFSSSNVARAKLKLPELVLDGPPPRQSPMRAGQVAASGPARVAAEATGRILTPEEFLALRGGPGGNGPPANMLEPMHMTFRDVADAIKYAKNGRLAEHRAAMDYLGTAAVEEASRVEVAGLFLNDMGDAQFRQRGFLGFMKWGTKANAAGLREVMRKGWMPTGPHELAALEMLLEWKDVESAGVIAAMLKKEETRMQAAMGLISLGAASESAVMPYAGDRDAATKGLALDILRKVGTEKSLPAFHRALEMAEVAPRETVIEWIKVVGERANLKPEKYMYVLIDRYKIEAPAGFELDPRVMAVNTREWTRTMQGRSVKSSYRVSVRYAGPEYVAASPPNAPTLDAVGIVFKQISITATPVQKTAKYAAVDGDCVLELTAVLDNSDTAAATSMNAAAKSIQAK